MYIAVIGYKCDECGWTGTADDASILNQLPAIMRDLVPLASNPNAARFDWHMTQETEAAFHFDIKHHFGLETERDRWLCVQYTFAARTQHAYFEHGAN